MRFTKTVVAAAVAIIACAGVAAQGGSGSSEPRFEVASVKPVKGRVLLGYRPTPGQFTGQMALIDFIALAYGMPRSRIVGAEPVVLSEFFNIAGNIPADAKSSWGPMLRNLLEERFALKVHREMQDLRVYLLVKARSDGRLGPNLRQASGCSNEPSSKVRCAMSYGGPANPGVAGQMDWGRFNLAGILSTALGNHVVDRTGLSGEFSLRLNWAYETPPLTAGDAPVPEGPSLFAALEEQLGLKLETATEPVEVLVIGAVSQPTPD